MKRSVHRAIAFVHRQLYRAERVVGELPLVLFDSPTVEANAMMDFYGLSGRYVDPANQRMGLHPFERRALERFFPKPPARLLLPGCGGGRELLPLVELGYEVDAFDPTPMHADAAKRLVGDRATVERSSLEEWVTRPARASYDGIFMGWAVWTHLLRKQDRMEALRGMRAACPSGPLLLSFFRRERVFNLEEVEPEHDLDDQGRLVRLFRQVLREKVLGRPPLEEGTEWSGGMFAHHASEAELVEEGGRTGWVVTYYERDASRFPHAVLKPSGNGTF